MYRRAMLQVRLSLNSGELRPQRIAQVAGWLDGWMGLVIALCTRTCSRFHGEAFVIVRLSPKIHNFWHSDDRLRMLIFRGSTIYCREPELCYKSSLVSSFMSSRVTCLTSQAHRANASVRKSIREEHPRFDAMTTAVGCVGDCNRPPPPSLLDPARVRTKQ